MDLTNYDPAIYWLVNATERIPEVEGGTREVKLYLEQPHVRQLKGVQREPVDAREL